MARLSLHLGERLGALAHSDKKSCDHTVGTGPVSGQVLSYFIPGVNSWENWFLDNFLLCDHGL